VDCHHKQTKAVLKTGKLPPVPKIPRLDPGFAELLMRVGGSLAKLREIVDAHERQAGAAEPGGQAASIPLNPLPSPPADPQAKPAPEPPQGPTPR
jgi:hypothetical protein